jgi:two-component system cell cycle sensor histidine kinase/response regulator CckA
MAERPISVLLVDDDEDDYIITRDLLSESEGESFCLEWIASYETALEAIGHNLYDVYLFDYHLGERTGLDLFREAIANDCRAPMILLTGQGDRRVDLEAMAAGAVDYLVKGQISAPLLERSIRYALERKRAEEALRELNASLEAQVVARTAEIRAEKEKSETILRNVGDAILMADEKMRIQYVNPAFTILTGYTVSEVLGQHAALIGASAGSEPTQESIEAALVEGDSWQGEVVAMCKDGRTYDAMLTVVPMHDDRGRFVGCVASHQDISQRKELERARQQFLTNISHQLRTPVTSLKLSSYLLGKEMAPENTERFLQIIAKQTDRLAHLVQDILEVTGLDSGLGVTTWEPVSLGQVVRNVGVRFQSKAQESDLALTVAPLLCDLPIVKGDPVRLSQALEEVVENALTFTPPGGQVMIEVRAVEENGQTWVTISVRDNGPGISLEEQGHVFERFFRGHLAESGQIPGTGLGLSIVQEIVRAHGGRVTVESEIGQGSTFRLWLRSAGHTPQDALPQTAEKKE